MLDFGDPKIKQEPLVLFYREPFERPSVGGLIEYKKIQYRVVSCTPSSNPDNQSVTYVVRVDNPNRPYRPAQVVKKRGYNSGSEQLSMVD